MVSRREYRSGGSIDISIWDKYKDQYAKDRKSELQLVA